MKLIEFKHVEWVLKLSCLYIYIYIYIYSLLNCKGILMQSGNMASPLLVSNIFFCQLKAIVFILALFHYVNSQF